MIKIENIKVKGYEEAIRGMRNSWNSWDKSDNGGPKDRELMERLCNMGPSHSKFRRMIVAWMDITAPLYWWKEFDTYKVGTVANSCSTMHTICDKEFESSDFSFEYVHENFINEIVKMLNLCRHKYLDYKDLEYFYEIVQLLPESYNQKRTVMLNYEVLASIYKQRLTHKLKEWRNFCFAISFMPYSFLIKEENQNDNL